MGTTGELTHHQHTHLNVEGVQNVRDRLDIIELDVDDGTHHLGTRRGVTTLGAGKTQRRAAEQPRDSTNIIDNIEKRGNWGQIRPWPARG